MTKRDSPAHEAAREMTEVFAAQLDKLCRERGVGNTQLAEALGCSRQYVHGLRTQKPGRGRPIMTPSRKFVAALAAYFEVKTSYFDGDGDAGPVDRNPGPAEAENEFAVLGLRARALSPKARNQILRATMQMVEHARETEGLTLSEDEEAAP